MVKAANFQIALGSLTVTITGPALMEQQSQNAAPAIQVGWEKLARSLVVQITAISTPWTAAFANVPMVVGMA